MKQITFELPETKVITGSGLVHTLPSGNYRAVEIEFNSPTGIKFFGATGHGTSFLAIQVPGESIRPLQGDEFLLLPKVEEQK